MQVAGNDTIFLGFTIQNQSSTQKLFIMQHARFVAA
jgi:hypothetical protein